MLVTAEQKVLSSVAAQLMNGEQVSLDDGQKLPHGQALDYRRHSQKEMKTRPIFVRKVHSLVPLSAIAGKLWEFHNAGLL